MRPVIERDELRASQDQKMGRGSGGDRRMERKEDRKEKTCERGLESEKEDRAQGREG